MAARKSPKKVRHAIEPHISKRPKHREDPAKSDHELFSWRVSDRYIDYDHPKYGWDKVSILHFLKEIVQSLQSYEGLTWLQVKCKDHCHPCELCKLPGNLLSRLEERQILIDELFQISFGNKPRLMGYRDRKAFFLIWFDPEHEIWPTKAR